MTESREDLLVETLAAETLAAETLAAEAMTSVDGPVELDPEGYLKRMGAGKRESLTQDARMTRVFEAEQFLELCAYCGLENSMIGGLFGMVSLLGGLTLIGMGLHIPR